MLLKEPGDKCLIDFVDIVSWLMHELKKYDSEVNRHDRRKCSEVVYTAIDNFFTENLIWTNRKAGFEVGVYLNLMPAAVDRHFSPYDLMEEMVSKVSTMFNNIGTFPSWNYFYLHRFHDQVSIEMGEDFRIEQFMKEHGKEYGYGENNW